jgi:SAM-dependent methyltransferase
MSRQEAGLFFRLGVVSCSPVPPNNAMQTDGRFAAAAERQRVSRLRLTQRIGVTPAMAKHLSPRLAEIVEALPLRPGARVLEIGCGPGAAARAIAKRIGDGHILAIDRSAKAIQQAQAASQEELASGRMSLRQVAIEEFALESGEPPFDIAFAVRVGALDGRHPHLEKRAHRRIADALAPDGQFFVDTGNPLRRVELRR